MSKRLPGWTLVVLMLIAWLLTLRYAMIVHPTPQTCIAIYGGGIGFLQAHTPYLSDRIEIGVEQPLRWKPRWQRRFWALTVPAMSWSLFLPLWIPLLMVTLVLMFLWRGSRHLLPNHCQVCGYDLTGNVSGRCSECGTPTARLVTNHIRDESVT